MSEEALVVVGKRLDSIGWGKYQYYVFANCGIGWATDQIWAIVMGFIIKSSGDEWNLSTLTEGLISDSFIVGLLIGAYFWGVLGDKYGRKFVFRKTVLMTCISCLAVVFSVNYIMMMAFLFLVGMGAGGEIAVGGTVYTEFCPPKKLWSLTFLAACWGIGGTVAALIGLAVDGLNTISIAEWRIICFAVFFIELGLTILRWPMDETPSYYLAVGNNEKAQEVLNKIARSNRSSAYVEGLERLNEPETSNSSFSSEKKETQENSFKKLIGEIFSKEYLKTTLVMTTIYVLACFAYTSVLYFMPEFLDGVSQFDMYGIIVLQQFCGVPGVLLGSQLVETRLGRKGTLMLSFGLSSLFSLLFLLIQGLATTLVFTSLLNFSTVMGYSALYTITPESYKTEIRNIGSGWANACARIGGIASPPIVGALLDANNGSKTIPLILFAVFFGVSSFSAIFLKETRGQISKETPK
mmetsp:Transcript_979/g.1526  ORF Transcript_979/g.1526 Transcript_979/m.1526 type:complete len:466 (-) Transcript_979:3206-4603(-)